MTQEEKIELQRKLKELSSKSGGSLVKRLIKSRFSETSTVLFVGLGGLGSKTINEMKKIYTKEFAVTNRVKFLAVDTHEQDLRDIAVGVEGGYVETSEQFQVFDNEAIDLLMNPPIEVKDWLGDLLPRPLDNTGAQATRQVGRIMLCGTQKYTQLKTTIKNKIEELRDADTDPTHSIYVVLVAGISGGTGSGTFVDVSYMIRDILADYEALHISTKSFGCFYTPDVQKHVPAIAGDPVKWTSLRRNGYASLKELDYFMTNGSHAVGAPTVYELRAPGGVHVTSSKPIFDDNCAFIVSPNTMNTSAEDIVSATARSLIYMHQDVANAGGATQSILGTFCNTPGLAPIWSSMHVGKSPNATITEDPAGIDNTNYPAFMNYRYSSFGYNSVYFPRDEMMAYCANTVLTEVINTWKNVNLLNQNNVGRFANKHNIATLEQIVSEIKRIMTNTGYNDDVLRVDKVRDANYWPTVIGGGMLGSVSGTSRTMEAANLKAQECFNSFNNQQTYRAIVDGIADGVINELNSPAFMQQFGPFCCIAILTGYGDIRGCCDNFDDLMGQLERVKQASDAELEAAKIAMQNEAARLEKDHTPTPEEIKTFIDLCHQYSKACMENGIYNNFLGPVVMGVKNKLKEFNNETFEIFVPVMEILTTMLNDDSTIFVQSNHQHYAGGQSFGMDAYGILQSQAKQQQFVQVLGAGVNPQEVNKVASEFAKSMFNNASRAKWIGFKENPEALADEIRNIFSGFFGPFVNNLLEKFMVLAYNNNNALNLNAQTLDEIWNAQPGTPQASIRDSAITTAASQIARQLKNGGSILTSYENGQGVVDELSSIHTLMLLAGTPVLNAKIVDQFAGTDVSVGYINDDCKSVITAIKFAFPVALPLIKGMKEFAQVYYESANDMATAAGRHLDEKSQNWVKYLPELYGVDAVDYYVSNKGRNDLAISYPKDGNGNPKNDDKYMYSLIGDAVEYGISMGYISELCDSTGMPKGYKILNITETTDNYASLFEKYKKMLDNHEGSDWSVALERAASTGNITYDFVEISCDNSALQGRILANPLRVNGLKNLYRVVRSNMRLERMVLEAKEKYSLLFERLHDMKVYSERMDTFVKMVVCDTIKNDAQEKQWSYTYSTTSPAVTFFEYKAGTNHLDDIANIYHAFVVFCNEVNDEMYAEICSYVKELDDAGKRDLLKRDAFVAKIQTALNDLILTKKPESERFEEINRLRNSSNDKYRLLYDMPVKFDGDKSVYNNIVNFYTALSKKLTDIK